MDRYEAYQSYFPGKASIGKSWLFGSLPVLSIFHVPAHKRKKKLYREKANADQIRLVSIEKWDILLVGPSSKKISLFSHTPTAPSFLERQVLIGTKAYFSLESLARLSREITS